MLKPYYEDEQVTLYNADCREVIPTLKARSVQAVVTDPPYGVSQECNLTADGIKKYGGVDFGAWDDIFPLDVLPLLASLQAHSYYIFCPYQVLGDLSRWASNHKMLERVLWWKKTNPTRRNGDVYWSIPGEHCFYAKRSGAPFFAPYDVGYFEHRIIHLENHPTEKPVPIIQRFVLASTSRGDTVCDTYTGSGTTGVACVKEGRKFIGMEISEEYCAIALRRIKEAQAQLTLQIA
jgi:DNA modification methylase